MTGQCSCAVHIEAYLGTWKSSSFLMWTWAHQDRCLSSLERSGNPGRVEEGESWVMYNAYGKKCNKNAHCTEHSPKGDGTKYLCIWSEIFAEGWSLPSCFAQNCPDVSYKAPHCLKLRKSTDVFTVSLASSLLWLGACRPRALRRSVRTCRILLLQSKGTIHGLDIFADWWEERWLLSLQKVPTWSKHSPARRETYAALPEEIRPSASGPSLWTKATHPLLSCISEQGHEDEPRHQQGIPAPGTHAKTEMYFTLMIWWNIMSMGTNPMSRNKNSGLLPYTLQ